MCTYAQSNLEEGKEYCGTELGIQHCEEGTTTKRANGGERHVARET